MTTINIGTNKGNIQGIKIDKPFNEITVDDVKNAIKDKIRGNIYIYGFCEVKTNLKTNENEQD